MTTLPLEKRDDWPPCPVCGRDTLMSLSKYPGDDSALSLAELVEYWTGITTQQHIDAGMVCLTVGCDYELEPVTQKGEST